MNGAERERLVDSALDRALGPQLVEPRDGFEERILANLPKEVARRPWWQWMWIPALAAVALLAVVIGMRVMHREAPAPQIVNRTVEAPQQQVAVKPQTPAPQAVRPHRQLAKTTPQVAPKVVITSASSDALPRMNVFPSPSPLSEQERLLLALSRRQRGEVEIAANTQSAERERAQKYFDTGYAPEVAATAPLDKK